MVRRVPLLLALAALAAPVAVLAQDREYEIHFDRPSVGFAAMGEVERGRVLVRAPDSRRYRRFRGGVILMGSYVDATRGRLRLTVARGPNTRRTWSAVFYTGKFQVDQETKSPFVTELRLVGGDFEACDKSATISAKRKRKRIRRLWGDGRGRFRTRGRHAAATVRGTKWTLEDRCDSTLAFVARGEVEVEDFTIDEDPPPATPEAGGDSGGSGGGAAPGAAPVSAPGARNTKPRRVRIRRGQRYVARPRS